MLRRQQCPSGGAAGLAGPWRRASPPYRGRERGPRLGAGSLSAELAALSELRVLNMANNQLTGTLPPAFGSSLRNLRELDLSGNPLQVLLLLWLHLRMALCDRTQRCNPWSCEEVR